MHDPLRGRLIVVPRSDLLHLFIVGLLMGAGSALSVAALFIGNHPMYFGFPIALVICGLIAMMRNLLNRSTEAPS